MTKTVEDYLARAADCRAAAAAETLANVRRLHLQAAATWERLADRAPLYDPPCRAPQPGPIRTRVAPRAEAARPPRPVAPEAARLDWPRPNEPATADPSSAPPGRAAPTPVPATNEPISVYAADGNLRRLREIEADVIRRAIALYGGRLAEVARRLGIGRSTLYRKMEEFGILDKDQPVRRGGTAAKRRPPAPRMRTG
jgi:hypothetical protein